MKKILYTGLFFTAFLWQSCGDSPEKKQPKQSVEVTTAVVEDMASSNFLTVSGKVEAEQSATLSTQQWGMCNAFWLTLVSKCIKGNCC